MSSTYMITEDQFNQMENVAEALELLLDLANAGSAGRDLRVPVEAFTGMFALLVGQLRQVTSTGVWDIHPG